MYKMSIGISHFRMGKKLIDGGKKAHIDRASCWLLSHAGSPNSHSISEGDSPTPILQKRKPRLKVKALAQGHTQAKRQNENSDFGVSDSKSMLSPYYFAFFKEIIQFIQGSTKPQGGELIFSVSQSKLTKDGIRTQTSQTLGQALVLTPLLGPASLSFCTSGLNPNLKI